MRESTHPEWVADQMIRSAQDGDAQALVALIEAAHPHVRRFAAVLCSSNRDAEDATQEALLVLFQKIGSLRAVGALSSWTFRIVRNECLRLARQLKREALSFDGSLDGSFDAVAVQSDASAEVEVFRRLEAGRIAAVISALPDDQRRVLVLRDVYGRSGREVARDLGLSTAAMKSRLHRARAAVKQSLTEEGR